MFVNKYLRYDVLRQQNTKYGEDSQGLRTTKLKSLG